MITPATIILADVSFLSRVVVLNSAVVLIHCVDAIIRDLAWLTKVEVDDGLMQL